MRLGSVKKPQHWLVKPEQEETRRENSSLLNDKSPLMR